MDASTHLSAQLTEQCAALLDVDDGRFKPTVASSVLDEFEELDEDGRTAFFRYLHRDLAPDPDAVGDAIARWQQSPSQQSDHSRHPRRTSRNPGRDRRRRRLGDLRSSPLPPRC